MSVVDDGKLIHDKNYYCKNCGTLCTIEHNTFVCPECGVQVCQVCESPTTADDVITYICDGFQCKKLVCKDCLKEMAGAYCEYNIRPVSDLMHGYFPFNGGIHSWQLGKALVTKMQEDK